MANKLVVVQSFIRVGDESFPQISDLSSRNFWPDIKPEIKNICSVISE